MKGGIQLFNDIEEVLEELRSIPIEGECIEFKEAKKDFSFDQLGKYFCALSNEANLKNKRYSWLVFGIKDKGNPKEFLQHGKDIIMEEMVSHQEH